MCKSFLAKNLSSIRIQEPWKNREKESIAAKQVLMSSAMVWWVMMIFFEREVRSSAISIKDRSSAISIKEEVKKQ